MLNQILLLSPPPEGQEAAGNSSMMSIIFFAAFFLILYFFMIRPQSKKAKEAQNFIDTLKAGDKVITNAGIHGKIASVNEEDKTFLIQVDGPTRLKIEKSAINSELSKALNAAPAETK